MKKQRTPRRADPEEPTWPDYTKIQRNARKLLIDDTITVIETRDRDRALAGFFSTRRFAPSLKGTEKVFIEDWDNVLFDTIAFTLRQPKRKRRPSEPKPDLKKAVAALRTIYSGSDERRKDRLDARLWRSRGGWGRSKWSIYDSIILGHLKMLASYIRAEWQDGNLKRWPQMPTPEEVAVEYFLRAQNCADNDESRSQVLGALADFKGATAAGKRAGGS